MEDQNISQSFGKNKITKRNRWYWVKLAALTIITGLLLIFFWVNVYLPAPRVKSKDAHILSLLGQMRARAEIYYEKNENAYSNLCASDEYTTYFLNAITEYNLQINVNVRCMDDGQQYAISALLRSGLYGCVDSTGMFNSRQSALHTGLACDAPQEAGPADDTPPRPKPAIMRFLGWFLELFVL